MCPTNLRAGTFVVKFFTSQTWIIVIYHQEETISNRRKFGKVGEETEKGKGKRTLTAASEEQEANWLPFSLNATWVITFECAFFAQTKVGFKSIPFSCASTFIS